MLRPLVLKMSHFTPFNPLSHTSKSAICAADAVMLAVWLADDRNRRRRLRFMPDLGMTRPPRTATKAGTEEQVVVVARASKAHALLSRTIFRISVGAVTSSR